MNRIAIASLVSASLAAGALAQSINVNDTTVTPLGTIWYNPPGENTGAGGGSSSIDASYTTINADGSARIVGDRTRYINGILYNNNASPSLGLASSLTALSYDWTVASVGVGGVDTARAPVLRIVLRDPTNSRRVEIRWEDGEQIAPQFNQANPLTYNTVNSGSFMTGRLVAFTAGSGLGLYDGVGSLIPGSDSAISWSALLGSLPSNTFITGISLGVGSSGGVGTIGYADNVRFAAGSIDTTMNFVPTPGAAALLGLAGLAATRRRR